MRERERERVTSSPRFSRRHKVLFGIILAAAVLLYAGFNVWVYQYSKGGGTVSQKNAGFGGFQRESDGRIPTPAPRFTPTPTPRPTGPGTYACSPEGVCNLYSDEMRKQYCTTTYADSLCLDQCGDKTKQCKL